MGRLPAVILLLILVETVEAMALQVGVCRLRLAVRNSGILFIDLPELVNSSYALQCAHSPCLTLLLFARRSSCVVLALN